MTLSAGDAMPAPENVSDSLAPAEICMRGNEVRYEGEGKLFDVKDQVIFRQPEGVTTEGIMEAAWGPKNSLRRRFDIGWNWDTSPDGSRWDSPGLHPNTKNVTWSDFDAHAVRRSKDYLTIVESGEFHPWYQGRQARMGKIPARVMKELGWKCTKLVGWVLRHGCRQQDLYMSRGGWVKFSDIVQYVIMPDHSIQSCLRRAGYNVADGDEFYNVVANALLQQVDHDAEKGNTIPGRVLEHRELRKCFISNG